MMELIKALSKITPDVMEIILKRYNILYEISLHNIIGRRALASKLDMTERVIRSEVELLKALNLLDITSSGMAITDYGNTTLNELTQFVASFRGMDSIECKLKSILNVKDVVVIPNNCDLDPTATKILAKTASNYFIRTLGNSKIVGITGGSTMMAFSESVQQTKQYSDLCIVPARGALGEHLESQSNNIASKLANQLNANYYLLHMTDTINADLQFQISTDPSFIRIMEKIKEIDYLVFGIGDAEVLAKKRNSSDEQMAVIKENSAVAEAFGHYVNISGEIVLETPTLGIKFNQYKNMKNCLAVAAGKKKAAAILAISRINSNLVLVIDEGAANGILELN